METPTMKFTGKFTGKYTGCALAVLGLLASGSLPAAAAASLSSYGSLQSAIQYNGMTAGLRFTVPLGGDRATTPAPRLALGLDFYRSSTPTGEPFNVVTSRASLASIDFGQHGFERLAIGNRTALSTSYDPVTGRHLDFFTPKPSTLLWGAVVIGAAAGVYFLVEGDGKTPAETAQ
jgi:hypothetical protein